jgi:hypothetical protein
VPLAAQEEQGDTFFCITIPAAKIYSYARGYVFTYRKNSAETGRIYLPYEWFQKTVATNTVQPKGTAILLRKGGVWPYLTIFYRNGEFSHIKLYARPESQHTSWGALPSGVNLEAEFDNADPPKPDFGYGK